MSETKMAISTQRLLIIFFTLNIFMGIIGTIYQNPTATTNGFSTIQTHVTNTETKTTEINSEETKYTGLTNENTLTETTIGNPLTTSGIIWNIFTDGFNPFAIMPGQAETNIEEAAIWIIMLMKSMIYILLIYELYLVLKNKKAS